MEVAIIVNELSFDLELSDGEEEIPVINLVVILLIQKVPNILPQRPFVLIQLVDSFRQKS